MKIKTKRTKTPYQRLKDRAWDTFSRFIRTRDCLMTTGTRTHGKCISCPGVLPFKDLQAGHFMDSRCNSILFDEECVHAQCRQCNVYKNGNKDAYRIAMDELYGRDYREEIELRKFQKRDKYTEEELREMMADWNKRMDNFGAER